MAKAGSKYHEYANWHPEHSNLSAFLNALFTAYTHAVDKEKKRLEKAYPEYFVQP